MSSADGDAPAPGASAVVARNLAPAHVGAGVERPITVDQTNTSVVVDEAVIVKWFRPPVPLPHPALDLLAHLRAVGFADMPEYFGIEARDDTVVAMASGFMAGALDGWDWFVDQLTDWADGSGAWGAVAESAAQVGRLAGALHVAVATPSEVLPAPVTQVDPAAELPRAQALLDEALRVTEGEPAMVLRRCTDQIRAVLSAWPHGGSTPAVRLHGDLHIGQILRSPTLLVVTDFDGNPLLDAAGGHAPRPAAIDVASLLQSIDHAVRVAQNRRPERSEALERSAELIAAAAAAYRDVLDGAGRRELLDERLLWPLQVTQELHELVYAARYLPRWAYAPTATLRSMFLAHTTSPT